MTYLLTVVLDGLDMLEKTGSRASSQPTVGSVIICRLVLPNSNWIWDVLQPRGEHYSTPIHWRIRIPAEEQ